MKFLVSAISMVLAAGVPASAQVVGAPQTGTQKPSEPQPRLHRVPAQPGERSPSAPQPQVRMGEPQMVMRMRPRSEPPAFTGNSGQTALTHTEVYPIVDVVIAGRTFHFIVDTGAMGHGRVKPEVATALGLGVSGTVQAGDGSGRVQDRRQFSVPVLTVAGVEFRNLDMAEYVSPPGRATHFDGVLGLGMFVGHTLTLDYSRGQLRLSQDPLPATAVTYDNSRGPILMPLMIGATALPTVLDTGNAIAGLIVPADVASGLPKRGEPRAAGRGGTAYSTVEFFEIDLAAPVTLGGSQLPITRASYPSLGPVGNMGSKALQSGSVTIDQRNSRIQVTQSGS
ncbi:MAG: aspartyl protease family protein [Sphingosinicella sp.]|nr:aspartyl protease family protein [Sphingosinicella sp.]